MIYKLKNGGIAKLKNKGKVPEYGDVEKIAAYNREHGTNFYKMSQVIEHDKQQAQKKSQDKKKTIWNVLATGAPESAGEAILNKTIETANNAELPETREDVYKDTGKKQLATTAGSILTLPMLGEFSTYGLLGGASRIAGGMAGSAVGSYALGKAGELGDRTFGTTWMKPTGQVIGGFTGWVPGSNIPTSLLRTAAGKGITLHMPQKTFMNLRGQYFNRAAKNIKYDNSVPWKLYNRDNLVRDYIEFGPTPPNYISDTEKNIVKLIHYDDMSTGKTSAVSINGYKLSPVYFPHFENGKLIPAIGQIRSKQGNGLYEHSYHPIFFGGNKPWWETPGSSNFNYYIDHTTFNNSEYKGSKSDYKRWVKHKKRDIRDFKNWYTKHGIQNNNGRYLITNPENLKDYQDGESIGIMGSEVPMSKLEGFEYDPLLGTFKRARYVDPSIPHIIPQKSVSTVHFDPRVKPLSRPINEFEKNGRYTLDELHQMGFKLPRKHLQGDDAVKMFKEYGTKYPETTRLYRVTGTSGNFTPSPDGTAEFAGQWFTNDPNKVWWYGENAFKEARRAGVENPIELQVVDIPTSQLEKFRAKNIIGDRKGIEFEPEDFIIPLETSRGRAPLNLTGNLLIDQKSGLPQIPTQDTPLMQQLRKYVPEARERYGLIGNTNITDDEIAGSLYKKVLDLGGDTAARNEFGEPLALFRGDTKRYLALKPRMSPEKLVNRSGTMDNSLGTLFLDDFGKPVLTHGGGPERYLAGWDYATDSWNYRGGGAGEPYNHLLPEIDRNTPSGILWGLKPAINSKRGHLVGFIKAPSKSTVSGVNDLNAFVVRTPKVRNATNEIAVLNENEDALLRGYWGSTPHHSGKLYTNVNGQERWQIGEESTGASKAPRKLLAEHFENVLNDAKANKEGLIMSEPGAILRDEHQAYGYYALPNFNILGAKHILPFDLRMPTQWGSRIIYRKQGGILKAQDGVPEIYGGELNPAVVKPKPVRFILRTDPITKNTPITHSSMKADPINKEDLGFFISKGSDDTTYNLIHANCSDATGECLEVLTGQDFTSGITTPISVSRKVRKVFEKQPEYTESGGGLFNSREQSFVVPWYDYRKAKDLHNETVLNSLLKKYSQDKRIHWSKEREDAIIKNWWEQRPKLKYDLDENNNVVNPLKR